MLAGAAHALLGDLGAARTAEDRWLAGQLEAVALQCDVRSGRDVPWQEQVERCLRVRPEPGSPEAYASVHAALDRLLPGRGPLVERWAEHRRASEVPGPLLPVLRGLVDRLRPTAPALPEGEHLRLQVRGPAPWSALCRSTGPLTSAVALDGARRWPAAALLAVAAHETYPGHHAERVLLADRPERQVSVVATPEAVVTEGLGEMALRGSGLALRDVADLLPAGPDLELADAVAAAAAPLRRTKTDAALLLHARGARAARAHLLRWGLHDDRRADAQLAFLTDPRWSVHAVAYGAGAALVEGWLDRGGAYGDLLGRTVTPGDLWGGP